MKKIRLVTIVLIGVLLGALAVKIQHDSVPLDERLVSANDATRSSALRTFARRSDERKEAVVDALIGRLKAKDPRERRFALYGLRKSGFSSPKIVNPMIDALADRHPQVREEARAGLLELGDAATPTMMAALNRLKSRNQVMSILSQGSPRVVPALSRALESSRPLESRGAAHVFARLSSAETRNAARAAIPALAAAIKSTDTILSVNAAFALNNIDPTDVRPAPVFLRLVRQKNWDDWSVRGWAAAEALGNLPAAAKDSVPVLTRILRTAEEGYRQKPFRRAYIADQLEKLDRRERTVNALTWDLKNRDAAIRYRALLILTSTPTVNPALAAPLVAALSDPDPVNAGRALVALTRSGLHKTVPAARRALPAYLAVLDRVDVTVVKNFRHVASSLVAGIGTPILPPLVDAVERRRIKLVTAMEVVDRVGKETVPYMKALMNDRQADVRLLAAVALSRLAPGTKGVKAELDRGTGRGEQVKRVVDRAKRRLAGPAARRPGAGKKPPAAQKPARATKASGQKK